MGNTFSPVGRALPPRRDGGVEAGSVAGGAAGGGRDGFQAPGDVPEIGHRARNDTGAGPALCVGPADGGDSIIVPMARDRLLEVFDRVQRPAEVASTLEGALTGQLWQQQLLFQAMIDTWPRLQKALREVKLAARKAPWRIEPHARRGEKPGARAEKLAQEVEEMVWGMKPDPVRGMKGFEGTVEELAMGYFIGHHVLEPHWQRRADGRVVPVSVLPVPPRYYGYPSLEEGDDRLMLDRNGSMLGVGGAALEDFPPHRFLVAVNGGHSGHPAQAAPLRVLAGYWLAAVYGLKWFMQFAQLFGIPFRWATYPEGDAKAKAELAAMMGNLGSQGWAAFKQGVEMNFLESGKGGGNLAQAELLRLADEQCDVFILGQTLTSSQGDSGSQALGNVHMEVRREVVEGVCDFVGEILTHQFIPAIVSANYGESRTDLPQMWAKWSVPKDERGMADRDKALGLLDGSMPVDRAWLYERHAVPMPEEGAVLFKELEKPGDEEGPGPGPGPGSGPGPGKKGPRGGGGDKGGAEGEDDAEADAEAEAGKVKAARDAGKPTSKLKSKVKPDAKDAPRKAGAKPGAEGADLSGDEDEQEEEDDAAAEEGGDEDFSTAEDDEDEDEGVSAEEVDDEEEEIEADEFAEPDDEDEEAAEEDLEDDVAAEDEEEGLEDEVDDEDADADVLEDDETAEEEPLPDDDELAEDDGDEDDEEEDEGELVKAGYDPGQRRDAKGTSTGGRWSKSGGGGGGGGAAKKSEPASPKATPTPKAPPASKAPPTSKAPATPKADAVPKAGGTGEPPPAKPKGGGTGKVKDPPAGKSKQKSGSPKRAAKKKVKRYVPAKRGNGGSYSKVRGVKGNEAHHMPPGSILKLMGFSHARGPAISMSAADHRKTESWGSSKEAKAYRIKMQALLEKGQFREAQRLDIQNIRELFPGKYERQIREMRAYTNKLYKDPKFKNLLSKSTRKRK